MRFLMPDEKEHIDKAHHNEDFFDIFDIDNTRFLDWAVTGLYYAALHYIDAYLATLGVKFISNHKQRHIEYSIALDRDVYSDYRTLENKSIIARYQDKKAFQVTPGDFRGFSKNELQNIKKSLGYL